MAISLSNNKGMAARQAARLRRQARGRKKITGSPERPRLVVTRSSRHLFAQVIDDAQGRTLAAASSLEKAYREGGSKGADRDAATAIGKLIAERAVAAGVTNVVFDRGPYLYHGRVKALAEGAREGGLNF